MLACLDSAHRADYRGSSGVMASERHKLVAPDARARAATDGELMSRAARGDVDAFAEIYDRHAALLLALASRMLRSNTEAQDLVHDVLIEAWQAARDYDASQAGIRTWLLIRLRSRALDRLGRSARYDAIRVALQPQARLKAELGTGQSERGLAVREALAELDADVREALQLTYFAGLTSAEIAERTGVPVGTVKSRLARGLQRLQLVLECEQRNGDDDG
jgi:RNA polymerase sigma-70 factor (ECF subfamily)